MSSQKSLTKAFNMVMEGSYSGLSPEEFTAALALATCMMFHKSDRPEELLAGLMQAAWADLVRIAEKAGVPLGPEAEEIDFSKFN